MFGGMRPAALQTVFGGNRADIEKIILNVVNAKDADFPVVAIESYESLRCLNGVGAGIATRLLAVAKPDRFVSLNGKSRAGLANLFGLATTTLAEPQNYGRLLETIYDLSWYREPTPQGEREKQICRMRAALLDCFVYDARENNRHGASTQRVDSHR